MEPLPSVIVFDVNETLSDMAPLAGRFAEAGAPELLARTWFAALLRDGFALAASGGKEPFARLAEGALRSALAGARLNRTADEAVRHVMSGFTGLIVHRDVPEGIAILRRRPEEAAPGWPRPGRPSWSWRDIFLLALFISHGTR